MPTPAILGIPFDANSSYLRGPTLAPAKIREAFHCESSNYWTETGVNLGPEGTVVDCGDVQISTDADAPHEIEKAILRILEKRLCPISLGGDHSVTYPILKAIAHRYPQVSIVHFDAHPDLYDSFEGSKTSHACPFARIMEEKLASRLVQVGIRTINGHQLDQAKRFNVKQFEMGHLPAMDALKFPGPLYISFDLDVLDPAFAPGVSHHEPGGMSVREVINYLHTMSGEIVGADIVEYNPTRDINGVTAMVAAKMLKEIAGKMILQES